MSSIQDLQRQLEVISRTTNMWKLITDQMEVINTIENISSTLDMVSNQINVLNNINISQTTSKVWTRHFETYQSSKSVDFAKIIKVQDSFQCMLNNYDFSLFTSVFDNFTNNLDVVNISSTLGNLSNALKMYDSFKFKNAIQNVFNSREWLDSLCLSDIIEDITERYIVDSEFDESTSEEIREVVSAKDEKMLTEQQKKVWEVYIYPFLISLFFFLLSSNQSQTGSANKIEEVNNYYTVEIGMEVDTLNNYNFRLICENNVMPRIKPNCSSKVVGHLTIGKIVCIVKKYRKWIEITWKNDDGEYRSGWIQNYKVTDFK